MLLHPPDLRKSQAAKLALELLLVGFLSLHPLVDMFNMSSDVVLVEESFPANFTLHREINFRPNWKLQTQKLTSKFLSPV